jgi:hypothetical protein
VVKKLYAAYTRGTVGLDLIRHLLEDTKRIPYDGGHLLTFVFGSQCRAKPWVGATLRIQNSLIRLKDTPALEASTITGEIDAEQLELCYAINIP